MNTTAFVPGIPITLNYGEMNESIRSWIQKIVSGEKTYIFARIMHDDVIYFYTEKGDSFYDKKIKLPPVMHFDKILVGSIYAERQSEESDFIDLTLKLYANPKDDDKSTSELAKFRREMIRKFNL